MSDTNRKKTSAEVHHRALAPTRTARARSKAEDSVGEGPSGLPALTRLLEQVGMPDQEEQLVDSIVEALGKVRWSRTVPVSGSDAAFLRENAGLDDPSVLDSWTPEAEDALRAQSAAASAAQQLADTLNRDEIADALGIGPSRVSHRVRDGHLYAIRRDGKPRFPRWQVRDGAELPGLRTLVPVLEQTRLDPVSVSTFMAVPNDELDDHSPVDFLAGGGDPQRAVALLDAWARQ